MVQPSCRAWVCVVCGPRRARRLARAVDNDGYEYFVTLTRAPRDLLQGVRRAGHLLRAEGGWEWVWTAEAGSDTGMVHIHALVRGERLSQRFISGVAARSGFGRVSWVERAGAMRAGAYAAKAARYASKESARYLAWRDLNGGKRPWHWSRLYTRGEPMREFIARASPSQDPGPWQRVPPPGSGPAT